MVEQHHAVGEHQRLVVRQRADAGSETQSARPLGGHGDEHLGRGDDLVAGRVVLADPRLVVAQLVEPDDHLQIPLERRRGVLPYWMKGCQKDPEAHRGGVFHRLPKMDLLRTPDERFADLPGYPFDPHYVDVAASDDTTKVRVHYIDEGPLSADPVLMLHGEPSWSYLYRKMVPVIVAGGL